MSSNPRLRIAFVADSLHSGSGGGILSGEYVVDRLRRDHDVVDSRVGRGRRPAGPRAADSRDARDALRHGEAGPCGSGAGLRQRRRRPPPAAVLAVVRSARRSSPSSSAGRRRLPRPAGERPPQRGHPLCVAQRRHLSRAREPLLQQGRRRALPTAFAAQKLRDHRPHDADGGHLQRGSPRRRAGDGGQPSEARSARRVLSSSSRSDGSPRRSVRTSSSRRSGGLAIETRSASCSRDGGRAKRSSGGSLPISRTARRSASSRETRSSKITEPPTSSFTPARSSSRGCPCSSR